MSLRRWQLRQLLLMAGLTAMPMAALQADDGVSRLATYSTSKGETYFALSLQPDAKTIPADAIHRVMVIADTSASQTGIFRKETIEVIKSFANSLPEGVELGLMAADVEPVLLTDAGLVDPTGAQWEAALGKLSQRVPLGTTDMASALKKAAAALTEAGNGGTIVYVGDGITRSNLLDSDGHARLLEDLTARQVSVSSLALGPQTDVATLAALANATGGNILVRSNIENNTQEIGKSLADIAVVSVVWPDIASLPNGLINHLPVEMPPLRLDRDTLLIGQMNSDSLSGELKVQATVGGKPVVLEWNLTSEPSNFEFAFLPSLVEKAQADQGRTLPLAGSAALKEVSLVLSASSEQLVKDGEFALKSGDLNGAAALAREALKIDPENSDAQLLLDAAVGKNAAAAMKVRKTYLISYQEGEATPADEQEGAPLDTGVLDELANKGDLLSKEEEIKSLASQRLDAEVRAQLGQARKLLTTDPASATLSLKLLLEDVDRASEVEPGTKARLRALVTSAIQTSASKEARFRDDTARRDAARAAADASSRILAERQRTEDSVQQLVERFNALMVEERFDEANRQVAPEVALIAPDTVISSVTSVKADVFANHKMMEDILKLRRDNFIAALRLNEEALVPFVDDPPLVYPPAEVWQALTARRLERYGSFDLAGTSEGERKIYNSLKKETKQVSFTETPLQQVIDAIRDEQGIPIVLNATELESAGQSPESPVTIDLPVESGVKLRSALRIMLKPLGLTYIVRDEVLEITSEDDAKTAKVNRVYPVGDLLNLQPIGGGGMMGGMGGGMGGMGGGMGGMGGGMGGMGGMGGGMGGMGGGMGGMMLVEDEIAKKTQTEGSKTKPATPAKPATQVKETEKLPVTSTTATPASGSKAKNWESLFDQLDAVSEAGRAEVEVEIRSIVAGLMTQAEAAMKSGDDAVAKERFESTIQLVNTALRRGYPQPWMYEALSVSMMANKYPKTEIHRVLLSGLDFSGDPELAFGIAKYLAKQEMNAEAIAILRDITRYSPSWAEPYALGLELARESNDIDALKWACAGVLSQAWPKESEQLAEEAHLSARATYMKLMDQDRVVEAKAFEEMVGKALVRDLVVRVTWTGNADIDLMVEEPGGSVCSLSNPRTISGGMLLSDGTPIEKSSVEGFSETYVCPKGFTGEYKILVKRIYGEVTAGKVTVEVLTDYGTDKQKYMREQVPVMEKDALVRVAVDEGHRTEAIAEAHLANIQTKKIAAGRAVLAQQLTGSNGTTSSSGDQYREYMRFLAAANRMGRNRFPGAVGYMPIIVPLPQGASMSATAIVSADRRYVRVAPSPQFSAIGEVFTFNFVTGEEGTGTGGLGGAGGGGGGVGGGGLF
jgi:hypothetical protein